MTIITRQEIIDSLVCRRSCGHYSTSIDDPDPNCDCGKVIMEDNRNESDCICAKPNGKHEKHCDAYRLSEFMKKCASVEVQKRHKVH